MKARRITALIKKESLQVIRDPSAILIAFVLPLLLLFIFGYGINLDNSKIKIGLVTEEAVTDSVSPAGAFAASKYFDVTIGYDRRELEGLLTEGKIRGIVIIPRGFSAKAEYGAEIQVIADGSEPNTASFVHNYAQAVLQNRLLTQAAEKGMEAAELAPIDLETRIWFNPDLKSRNFLMPGSIAIIMTLIGTLLTSLVMAREWERGTMEAIMSKPVTAAEIIIGKLIPYYVLGMCAMGICFIVSVYLYEVPFRGSFAVLTLISSVYLIASLGQGLLISTIAKNQFVASQIALLSAFLPAFMLSGFIFEISSMPLPIRIITYIFPARYFVADLLTLFLAGNEWILLLKNTAAITFIAAVLFGITAAKTKKTLD